MKDDQQAELIRIRKQILEAELNITEVAKNIQEDSVTISQ